MRCSPAPIDLAAWRKQCQGKVRYAKKAVAIRAARQARARQPDTEPPIHHYRCPFGADHWHIGHQILARRLALEETCPPYFDAERSADANGSRTRAGLVDG